MQEKLRRLDWQSKNSVVSGQETGEKNEPPRHKDTKTQRHKDKQIVVTRTQLSKFEE